MHYLLAVIAAVTVAVLVWRAFISERVGTPPTRTGPIAPDDDPDFLRKLREQQRKRREDEA